VFTGKKRAYQRGHIYERDYIKESISMKETVYTAVIKKEGDWWIGWIEEVPGVNCQEPSREELLETLKITLQEALAFNRQDALSAAGNNYQEEKIAL
jgi:predicted RNase H-like HicB family nuclease